MKTTVIALCTILTFVTTVPIVSAEAIVKYIGCGFGQSSLDISDQDADSVDDTDTSFKLFAGISPNPNFALELGYADLGEYSAHYPSYDETDRAEADAFFATAIFLATLTDHVSLLGKIGFADWHVDCSVDLTAWGTRLSASGDGNGIDLIYGIGINLKAMDQLSIRAEWERYKDVGDGVDITFEGHRVGELEGEDVDVLGLALTFSF